MRVRAARLCSNSVTSRLAFLAVFAVVLLAVFGQPFVSADPVTPTPKPIPNPVAQPDSLPRDAFIGGARTSTNSGIGMGTGTGPPLAAARERDDVTVPVWAYDGIHLSSSWPLHNIVWHLPGEMTLAPAAWTGDGGAVYGSPDVDYLVRPYAGSGADIVITRKTVFSSSTIPFGLRLPEGSHLRQGVNTVLVESDASPGHPASTIATVSIPTATDANGVPLQVTPRLGPGFPQGQQNVIADLGPANPLAFPVTITIAYRPGELPTTGALNPDWQGMPEGTSPPKIVPNPGDYVSDPDGRYRPASVDPVLYRQRHAGGCQGGLNAFTSADGRTADFLAACQKQQMCYDVTPARTSVAACNGILLSDMSIGCTSAFGQTGDDYEACLRVANDQVAWAKANMLSGALCQPVTPNTNTAMLPATGNRYCTT
ncbi:Uncharacterised protein [Mycobacteroides abscessus subsp. abscessus]|uniref:Uncharacterized protein n=1 Tax=Mycobacteroides abscessus subsp. massiliense TaxID=1962118 RepID=A0A1T8KSX6_9MYCO|nr:hypothetical protein [Mycobacteroides abscessus]ORA88344.1 hypothetical protein BST32_17535 [Mycobacteroides abscessus subsp. massiliense]SIE12926.1 Uncharacterised protein [Mycobacteroides abscessus subsp. abscessus]SIF83293.1 Uncharacterised protein [Mycobacteroides abscessus subsp. abscessus]SIG02502.1 Uncharacterised protein [Mycobacteroides abscessus subsp. abscessus]SIG22259.1 Uncharacterised protein [Mycobacteroides abscessus subsp. abscessus]